jgi:hypothetical protein
MVDRLKGLASSHGTSGILYAIDTQQQLDALANLPKQTYAFVLPLTLVNKDNISKLQATGLLSGIVVLMPNANSSNRDGFVSPDSACPNCEFGLYKDKPYAWNPTSNGMIHADYDFPIFAIASDSPESYQQVKTAASENAKSAFGQYPLYAVEFYSFMWAARDAATCLRRGWCSPIGGLSVYASPSVNMKADDGKQIVLLSAALNGRSLFHDLTLGVANDVSGTVALLAAATALSTQNVPSLPRHIVYTFFNGESWGLAGSQRFVKDLYDRPFQCKKEFKEPTAGCPYTKAACAEPCRRDLVYLNMAPDAISAMVEVNQVVPSTPTSSVSLFTHVHTRSQDNMAVANVLSQQATNGTTVQLASNDDRRLPAASSIASFVERRAGLPHAVLSGFQDKFNKLYNADVDDVFDAATIGHVCSASTVLARSAYALASNASAPASLVANCTLVEELMTCLVKNYSCPLINKFVTLDSPSTTRLPHYSVYQYGRADLITQFVFRYMYNITASSRGNACKQITDCNTDAGQACIQGQCLSGMTKYHDAYGTGLEMLPSGLFKVTDASKGTWTESTWDPIGFRMFKVASTTAEVMQLVVGIVVTLLAIGAVVMTKRILAHKLKIN